MESNSRETIMGLEGVFMGSDYGRWSFRTFRNFLLGSLYWEDACQQHTVQNIMGSRGSKNWTHDFKVKDQHLSH